jgi:lipopolysaccharide transport system permease protein
MVTASDARERPAVVIRPSRGWPRIDLVELWRARELLYFFVWRDVKVRYKQTALGVGWAVAQPIVFVVLFTLLFSRGADVDHEGIPYPVFAYAGLVTWQLFAAALARASSSTVTNRHLLTHVYFPRLVVPLAAAGTALVDFATATLPLGVLLAVYDIGLSPAVACVPLFALLALLAAIGFGLWLSALNVRYRDITQIVPLLLIVWLFATPVAYSLSLVPQEWLRLYELNPMVGVTEGMRWALFGTGGALEPVLVAVAVTAVVLSSGTVFFRWLERSFADTV